jgi:hypothetical protein
VRSVICCGVLVKCGIVGGVGLEPGRNFLAPEALQRVAGGGATRNHRIHARKISLRPGGAGETNGCGRVRTVASPAPPGRTRAGRGPCPVVPRCSTTGYHLPSLRDDHGGPPAQRSVQALEPVRNFRAAPDQESRRDNGYYAVSSQIRNDVESGFPATPCGSQPVARRRNEVQPKRSEDSRRQTPRKPPLIPPTPAGVAALRVPGERWHPQGVRAYRHRVRGVCDASLMAWTRKGSPCVRAWWTANRAWWSEAPPEPTIRVSFATPALWWECSAALSKTSRARRRHERHARGTSGLCLTRAASAGAVGLVGGSSWRLLGWDGGLGGYRGMVGGSWLSDGGAGVTIEGSLVTMTGSLVTMVRSLESGWSCVVRAVNLLSRLTDIINGLGD